MQVLSVVLMFLVAVVFSMLGQGGGVLYTPIQVWTGVDFHVAATTSLFLIMVVSLSASIVFRQARKIDWPLAIVLEAVTVLGGFAGGLGSARVSAGILSILFAIVVFVAAIFMIRPIPRRDDTKKISSGGLFAWRRQLGAEVYQVNLGLALPFSFAAGIVSGMVGVGGGVLKVPMMVLLLGVPLEIAIGSSAVMVGITAGAGFAGHVINGDWDWRQSLALAAVVFIGGQIGSRISIRADKRKLKRFFGWFLLVVAVLMFMRAANWIPSVAGS